jgi:hypothetical protein
MGNFSTSMYPIRPPGEGVQPVSPVDAFTKATELQNMMQRSKLLPLEIQRTQLENQQLADRTAMAAEDKADSSTLQDLYGQVQNDASIPADKKLEELRNRAAGKVKPRTLEALSKQIQDHQDALTKASDAHIKAFKDLNTEVGNTANAIMQAPPEKQAAEYAQQRQRLISSGLARPEDIPEEFDPDWVKLHAALGMGAVQYAETELKKRADSRAQAEEDRKARLDELTRFSQGIDNVGSQEEYTAKRNELSPANRALVAATWSPQNVATIKRLALTAEQQQQADQAATIAAETHRHNVAGEEAKPEPKTYTGDLRAALVAIGAKDPDNPTADEASKALDRIKPAAGEKPVAKSTLVSIENDKAKAIRDSKKAYDKDLAENVITKPGKQPTPSEQASIDQAWDDHVERLQDAQLAYENALTTATGHDVGHNDWADRLRRPGAAAAPSAPAAAATPNKPTATEPPPEAKAKLKPGIVTTFNNGQKWTLRNGKPTQITSTQ